MARTFTLRVATSTSGLMVVMAPSQVDSGKVSTRRRAFWFSFRSASACWGSQKSAWMGVTDWSEAMALPGESTWPSST